MRVQITMLLATTLLLISVDGLALIPFDVQPEPYQDLSFRTADRAPETPRITEAIANDVLASAPAEVDADSSAAVSEPASLSIEALQAAASASESGGKSSSYRNCVVTTTAVVTVITTAVGAVAGALSGGVGAIPGTKIGFKIGAPVGFLVSLFTCKQ